jgi:hypothetical protein
MRKFQLGVLIMSLFFLNGCATLIVGLGNNVKINPKSKITKGQTILVKQKEIDRLEFGRKIVDFFRKSGYEAVLASEKDAKANYDLAYDYSYVFDVFHNTLNWLDIIVKDAKSNEILVDAHFQAFSPRSADGLLQTYLEFTLRKIEENNNPPKPKIPVKKTPTGTSVSF